MLRFNNLKPCFSNNSFIISIHPMLRFNCFYSIKGDDITEFQYILCYGSTAFRARRRVRGMEFQYILCYGSTSTTFLPIYFYGNFNTSYVTVQL